MKYIFRHYIDPYPILTEVEFESHSSAMDAAVNYIYDNNISIRVDRVGSPATEFYYFILPESPGDNFIKRGELFPNKSYNSIFSRGRG